MINAARPNRTSAITSGCAMVNPNFVAVEAEDHNMENNIPAANQANLLF
jgi:hypothetical protein